MASPSDGSLSSGGLDQGSDAPTRDYEREVSDSRRRRRNLRGVDKDEAVQFCHGLGYKLGVIESGEKDFLYFRLQKTLEEVLTLVLVFKMQEKLSAFLTWTCVSSEAPLNTGPVESQLDSDVSQLEVLIFLFTFMC